jgi:hypothetical protein
MNPFGELAPRETLNLFYALLLGLVGVLVAWAYIAPEYRPIGAALIAVAVALVGLGGRQWIPAVAALLPLVWLGHVGFWRRPWPPKMPIEPVWLVWLNGGGVAAITLAGAFALDRLSRPRAKPAQAAAALSDDSSWATAEGFAHALWMITLQVVYWRVFAGDANLLAAVVTALAVAAVSLRFPLRLLGDFALLPMALALVALRLGQRPAVGTGVAHELCLWLAAAGAYGFACAYVVMPRLRDRLRILKESQCYQWLDLLLAIFIGGHVLRNTALFGPNSVLVGFGIAALATAALSRRPGLRPAVILALIYLLWGHALFYDHVTVLALSSSQAFLWATILLAALTLAYGLTARRWRPDLSRRFRLSLHWTLGAATLILLDSLFFTRGATLGHYITVCWGISAIGILLTGLLGQSKPLRLVGLAGLILCIPRVFLVDIQSTFYRIAAFVVLGVVLLVVGFLYTRFRSAIERPEA